MAYIYPFRMTSTTATLLLIDPIAREVIIGVRGDNAWVYPGADSLPGGFMEARYTEEMGTKVADIRAYVMEKTGMKIVADEFHDGEDSQDCAIREAKEELNIDLMRGQLRLFDVRANSRTDTRAHVTNVCYYAELTQAQSDAIKAGDDLKDIRRVKIAEFFEELPYEALKNKFPMAFNHFDLLIQGLLAWERECHYNELLAEVIQLRADNARLKERNTELQWERDGNAGLLNWGA